MGEGADAEPGEDEPKTKKKKKDRKKVQWIEGTRQTLGSLITRPTLTGKCLKKPPFRFLHAVISEVIRATGFGEGLYNSSEQDAESIGDKQAKLDFLNKMISCVSFALAERPDVSASKIVCGLEPEKTNGFLVKLHEAATSKLDASPDVVQRVLQGDSAVVEKKKKDEKAEADAEPGEDEPKTKKKKKDRKKVQWIEGTRQTLGSLITRPTLTDKYLKKPPFRFLHAVISEVIRATSFGEGLYNSSEQDAESIGDKQAKLDFLNKMISCVSFALAERLDVSASKIVCGLEPEKTNGFLVKLHEAATSKLDASPDAVQRVLQGDSAVVEKKKKKNKQRTKKKLEADA